MLWVLSVCLSVSQSACMTSTVDHYEVVVMVWFEVILLEAVLQMTAAPTTTDDNDNGQRQK